MVDVKNKGIWLDGVLYKGDGTSYNEKEHVDSFPAGYRFRPTDEELINHYLINKIKNKELPFNRIRDVKLYDFATPEKLTEKCELIREREWYFFTPTFKKYRNGERADRVTPGGYWKPTGGNVNVRTNGRTVGKKRTLCFYAGKSMAGKKTNWIMHEYRIIKPTRRTADIMKLDEWVLCKVFKRNAGREKDCGSSSAQVPDGPNQQQNRGILPAVVNPGMVMQQRSAQQNQHLLPGLLMDGNFVNQMRVLLSQGRQEDGGA
ncbi:hypothetical protein Pfo_030738 [Paulownia fortunei]|nr:hypothetical protein Pfo_030738 [Paulownia fortunei]